MKLPWLHPAELHVPWTSQSKQQLHIKGLRHPCVSRVPGKVSFELQLSKHCNALNIVMGYSISPLSILGQ